MAQTVSILLNAADRERLDQIVGDRNRPFKHVLRAKIVLLSGDRLPVLEVAHRAGFSRPAVWRWQQRFAEEGVDALLRDKTRKPCMAPISAPVVARIVALTGPRRSVPGSGVGACGAGDGVELQDGRPDVAMGLGA